MQTVRTDLKEFFEEIAEGKLGEVLNSARVDTIARSHTDTDGGDRVCRGGNMRSELFLSLIRVTFQRVNSQTLQMYRSYLLGHLDRGIKLTGGKILHGNNDMFSDMVIPTRSGVAKW